MTRIPVLKSLSESDLSINRNLPLLLSETTLLIINNKSLSKLKTKPNSSLLIKSIILKPLNKKSLILLLMISLIMLFLVFSINYRFQVSMEQSFVMDKHHQAKLILLLETIPPSSHKIKVYYQELSEKLYKEKILKYKI